MSQIVIRISTPSVHVPLIRQTPGGRGIWENCRFVFDDNPEPCDWWVVREDIPGKLVGRCDPEHTLLIADEPPPVRRYDDAFLAQFRHVLTCQDQMNHPGKILGGIYSMWFAGMNVSAVDHKHFFSRSGAMNFDDFSAMPWPEKPNRLSVICSSKVWSPGHARRYEFVQRLSRHFGSKLDVFGHGIRPIPDKWDALKDYRYHLVLENCVYPNYWTEKLADAYLGFCFPIYGGCPNIRDFFSAEACETLDWNDFDRSVAVIERVLATDPYESRRPAIAESRRRILHDYNIFSRLAEICREPSSARIPLAVWSQKAFRLREPRRSWYRLKCNLKALMRG